MKKLLLFIGLYLAILSSCQSHDDDLLRLESFNLEETTGVQHDIMVNIMTSRFGGYKVGNAQTRAAHSVSLSPYIDNGDTLLYVAQYSDGWELYSANTAAPMIVMSSEKGIFNLNDSEMPKSVKRYIQDYAEAIRNIPDEQHPVDRSWGHLSVTDEELANAKVICHKPSKTRASQDDYPSGDWFLIETEELSDEYYTSPKLIKTMWGGANPWNKYAKYFLDKEDGKMKPASAGCSAVAIGQYMYYTHFKDNIPIYAVTTATPINNGTDFTFSGLSSSVWNDMMPNAYLYDITEVAIFLGKLGRDLSADYSLNGTGVYPQSEISFLNKTYNTIFTIENVDYSKIKKTIDKSYPLLASAKSDDGSHLFLIDQYMERTVSTKYVYGLIRDQWDGDGDDPYQDNEVDEEGNITGFAYTKEVIHKDVYPSITMNWGENGNDDWLVYNPNGISWVANSTNYNQNHYIYIRSDVK